MTKDGVAADLGWREPTGFPHDGSRATTGDRSHRPIDTAGVDGDPAWGGWDAWTPAALRGLLPEAAAATPVAALDALLRTAARRLAGRRFTVPGTGLRLRVETLDVRPDPMGLALGQFDDVRLVARDLEWRGWACERLVLVCRNVHVRPLPAAAVVSAPVEVEVVLPAAVLRERVAARRPEARLDVGADGEARLRWARRPGWGAVLVAADVLGSAVHVRPVALQPGDRQDGRRIRLPRWLPPVRIPVPVLARGLRLREITTGPEVVVLRLVADEWREAVSVRRLAELLVGLDRLA
jgi:hypothetical protein